MSDDDTGTIMIDGRTYPMPSDLTFGEMRLMKRVCGAMPDLTDPVIYQDPDVLISLAIIVKERSGESFTEAQAEMIPLSALVAEPDAEEGDVDPPAGRVSALPSGGKRAARSSETTSAASGRR